MIIFKLVDKKDKLHIKEFTFNIDFKNTNDFIDYTNQKNGFLSFKYFVETNGWCGTHIFITGVEHGIEYVGYESYDIIDIHITYQHWLKYFTDNNLFIPYNKPSQGTIDMLNGNWKKQYDKNKIDESNYISVSKELITELKSHLDILENYLMGEHCHEIDDIQRKEDMELMNETMRLNKILRMIF